MSFEDLGLDVNILKALSEMGYEKPTPVQQATIPLTLSGRDVLGIAQTGTGKTASFNVTYDRSSCKRAGQGTYAPFPYFGANPGTCCTSC